MTSEDSDDDMGGLSRRYASAVSFISVTTIVLVSSGICMGKLSSLGCSKRHGKTYEFTYLALVVDLDGRLPSLVSGPIGSAIGLPLDGMVRHVDISLSYV